jgi:hypothetical protein
MKCGTLDTCVAISKRLKSSVCKLAILVGCVRYAMPLSNISDLVLWIELLCLCFII